MFIAIPQYLKGLWHASAHVRQLDFSPADTISFPEAAILLVSDGDQRMTKGTPGDEVAADKFKFQVY